MARLQRALVNLEILSEDINDLSDTALYGDTHKRLLQTMLDTLLELNTLIVDETHASFQQMLAGSPFETVFEKKQMVSVYVKLLGYVITACEATNKASLIINDNFDESADKRLELLQVKAIRAKSQLKTVATAMGKSDYQKFLLMCGLSAPEWSWDVLRARF
ncbi:hypothetical protein [Alteromonas sp. S167]|uniref:hypothetical protein n=1 Tax=Alteromonas sp. S167 TaxID=3117402 RepID=UPI002FE13623